MTGPPIFLICTARSGSTLLRRLLDAHPLLACPPETNLGDSFATIDFASRSVAPDHKAAEAMADELVRNFVDLTLGAYARRAGKPRWCDKSLTAVNHLDRLSRVFPDAQFICLYREATDTIASGLEASPWGFGGYGFEPYVAKSPGNVVAALATYWADKVEAELRFERANRGRCHRILYEDLVTAPATVLARLFSFLNLPWDETIMDHDRLFGRRKLDYQGDYKILYAQDFDVSSIGRGWNTPVDLIPRDVRGRIERLSKDLGYPFPGEGVQSILDALRVRFDPVMDLPAVSALMKRRVESVSSLFSDRVAPRLAGGTWTSAGVRLGGGVKVTLADVPSDGAGDWVIDFTSSRVSAGDHPSTSTILTDSETLLNIANGTLDPPVALRRAKLQIWSNKLSSPEGLLDRLDAVLSLFLPGSPS